MNIMNHLTENCMQDTFARATHSAAARPSARATIGYLVYNTENYLGNFDNMVMNYLIIN